MRSCRVTALSGWPALVFVIDDEGVRMFPVGGRCIGLAGQVRVPLCEVVVSMREFNRICCRPKAHRQQYGSAGNNAQRDKTGGQAEFSAQPAR